MSVNVVLSMWWRQKIRNVCYPPLLFLCNLIFTTRCPHIKWQTSNSWANKMYEIITSLFLTVFRQSKVDMKLSRVLVKWWRLIVAVIRIKSKRDLRRSSAPVCLDRLLAPPMPNPHVWMVSLLSSSPNIENLGTKPIIMTILM